MLWKHPRVEERRFDGQMRELFLMRLQDNKSLAELWDLVEVLSNLRVNGSSGDSWLSSHWRLTTEVYARHYFTVQYVFDSFDRQ